MRVAEILRWREVLHALFDLQIDMGVMRSPVVIPLEEWEHGLYQAAALRSEVDRDGGLV